MMLQVRRELIDRARRYVLSVEPLFNRLLAKAWPSYTLICALQLKILWNIWRYRDLTTGDTSSYFAGAYRWYDDLAVNIVWSPLYTAFYGTVLLATKDAYTATIFHRVIIVLAATLGVLALMRHLLPPALALLIAAWWAVMPINFETLYEVHLFALLPIIAAWLVTTVDDTPWTRGSALAILFASTLLVRNELLVAVVVFATICLVREIRARRRMGVMARESFCCVRIAGYLVPLLAAISVCAAFYGRSYIKYPAIIDAADAKHSLNMCQVFAFGYSQRHPEWNLSPWLECGGLVKSVFGYEHPTIIQMVTNNFSAALEHFLWNLSLTLNGIQVSLFNSMSGRVNPDYAPVTRSITASVLSGTVLVIVLAGVAIAFRHRDYWWSNWIRPRRGTWLIMLAVCCVALPVIITERPRPSYLFSATLVMMALIGTAAHILSAPRWSIATAALAVIAVPILLVFIPSYYSAHRSDRPLYANYQRLLPFAPLMTNGKLRILFGDYNGELRRYLRLNRQSITYDYRILNSWPAQQSLEKFLDSQGIDIVFIQPRVMPEIKAMPKTRQLLEHPELVGWRRLAPSEEENNGWLLLLREPSKPAQSQPVGPVEKHLP
jgi:hypothetical protein